MAEGNRVLELIVKARDEASRQIGDVEAKIKGFQGEVKNTQTHVQGLTAGFKGLLPALTAVALVGIGIDISKAAMDSERSVRLLGQTLKNIGQYSADTITTIQGFAESLMNVSGVTDEEVMASMNGLLKVTRDVKEAQELTKLALDMSAGSGRSLAEVSGDLELAILGNTRSLKKYGIATGEGVTVTDALAEAAGLYSGQAEKMGSSTEGGVKKAVTALDELKETAGKVLLPIIGWIAEGLTIALKMASVGIQNNILAFRKMGNTVGAVFEVLKGNTKAWDAAMKENEKLSKQQETNSANFIMQLGKQNKVETDISVLRQLRIKKDQEKEQEAAEKAAKAQEAKAEKIKKINEELSDKIALLNEKDLGNTRETIEKQKKAYEKAGADKELIAKWYAGEIAKIETEEEEKKAKKIEKVNEELTTKILQLEDKKTVGSKLELDKQKADYEKAGADKLKIAEWYNLEIEKLDNETTKKTIENLKIQSGGHDEMLLYNLKQLQVSLPEHTMAWQTTTDEIIEIQNKIKANYRKVIEDVVSTHTFDLIDGIRTGNKSVSTVFQDLIDDIVKRWEKMIADMVAQWVASQLLNLPVGINTGAMAGSLTGGLTGAGGIAGTIAETAKAGGALGSVGGVLGSIGGAVGGALGGVGGAIGGALGGIGAVLAPIAAPVALIGGAIGAIGSLLSGGGGWPAATAEEKAQAKSAFEWDEAFEEKVSQLREETPLGRAWWTNYIALKSPDWAKKSGIQALPWDEWEKFHAAEIAALSNENKISKQDILHYLTVRPVNLDEKKKLVSEYIPEFFKFAKGGIITSPTLAMIGEAGPEAIVPLSGANKVGTTVNNFNPHIEIKCEAFMGDKADAIAFAQKIDKELVRLYRTGQSVFGLSLS